MHTISFFFLCGLACCLLVHWLIDVWHGIQFWLISVIQFGGDRYVYIPSKITYRGYAEEDKRKQYCSFRGPSIPWRSHGPAGQTTSSSEADLKRWTGTRYVEGNKYRTVMCFRRKPPQHLPSLTSHSHQIQGYNHWSERRGKGREGTHHGHGGRGGRWWWQEWEEVGNWFFSFIWWPVVAREDCEITSEEQTVDEQLLWAAAICSPAFLFCL